MILAMAALLIVLGTGLLTLAAGQRKTALDATHWPTVMAHITRSEVHVSGGETMGGGPLTYIARVVYDYGVDGRDYQGNCISTGLERTASRLHPDMLALRYAPGSVAQIHYYPGDPSRAVLEIHPRGAGLKIATSGMLVILVGCLAVAVFLIS